jgi:hypothetical protein
LHPCNETYLVIAYDLFDVLLNSVFQYFVENLCLYINESYWSIILFSVTTLLGFGMSVMLVS